MVGVRPKHSVGSAVVRLPKVRQVGWEAVCSGGFSAQIAALHGKQLWRARGVVLLVSDVLAPGHRAAGIISLLHGDVGHEAVRRRAVPVVFVWLEKDAVPGADYLDRPATTLAEADTLGDVDRLPEGMGVPRGARARREVNTGRGQPRGGRRSGDRVDVDDARKPVARAGRGVVGASRDLHVFLRGLGRTTLIDVDLRYRFRARSSP